MQRNEIERRLGEVLANATGWLPPDELAEMLELVHGGEPGIALENFCTQLEEYDVSVPRDMANELRSLASAMGLPIPRWIERATHA